MTSAQQTTLIRRSPLARYWLGDECACLEAGTVKVEELPFQGVVRIQARRQSERFLELCREQVGINLPTDPNTCTGTSPHCLWVAVNEWLLVTPADEEEQVAHNLTVKLTEQLPGELFAVTVISDARSVFQISGSAARDLLAKGCSLDLHPEKFTAGRCAGTLLEQVTITLYRIDSSDSYQLMVDRSFAAFVWDWLTQAIKEFSY